MQHSLKTIEPAAPARKKKNPAIIQHLQAVSIKAAETAREYPVRGARGLYLLVHPSGLKVWVLRYRHLGKSRKLNLCHFNDVGLAEAKKLAAVKQGDIARGTDPVDVNKQKRLALKQAKIEAAAQEASTFEAIVPEFIKRHVLEKTRTRWANEVQRILAKEILPAWHAKTLSEITRRDVHVLLNKITDRPAKVLANRVLAVLARLYTWSIGCGIVETSPCIGFEKNVERKRTRVLSVQELAAIWKATDVLSWPNAAIIKTLVLTGMRLNEVAGGRWREIELVGKTWTVPSERSKTGEPRIIPLSPLTISVLKALPRIAPGDFIFSLNGRAPVGNYSTVKAALDKALPKDMEPWVVHSIRHTLATGLQGLKVQPHVIEFVLGHLPGKMTSQYQHAGYEEEARAALCQWAEHIAAGLEVFS
jgi:integrase